MSPYSPYLEKYKQNIAIEMRKRGLSYSEIENRIHIPKSTLSYWLKNLKLTPEQIKKLNDKRVEVAKANALKKISRTSKMIEEVKHSSSQDIKEISKKELWLMGVILYWKNGNKNDLRKGVHFSSSDPYLIKLFLKWLQEVGGINKEEIRFDIFIKNSRSGFVKNKNNKVIAETIYRWSKITGFPKNSFSGIYLQKAKSKLIKNGVDNSTKGTNQIKGEFLRIKVGQSSMLARQIAGWMEGVKTLLFLNKDID